MPDTVESLRARLSKPAGAVTRGGGSLETEYEWARSTALNLLMEVEAGRLKRAECKHERATFDHMADETRQVFRCDSCGWLHECRVDPISLDLVNIDARTGEITPIA